MERYKVIEEVGTGTFGSVWRAVNKQSGDVVAIKKIKKKYYSWEECIKLREVKSLTTLNHPNIVKLKEVIRENDVLYLVFEYMECSLYQLMKDRGKLISETEVRNWCFQVFQGLAYMHQHGYFHRDLKPENLLVSKVTIKIADFGLAREINSQPPFTEYVSTRWYRAPEVLLQSRMYGPPVDMWAMGAIMAELFTLEPLFPGLSEADQIFKICSVIGNPSTSEWPKGLKLASALNYQFPQVAGVNLSMLIPSVSEDAINLIRSLCSWNPNKRPTAIEVLQHPFFQSCYRVPPSLRYRATATARTPPSAGTTRVVGEQNYGRRYPSTVSNMKPANTFASGKPLPYAAAAGVQRKLDLNYRSTFEDTIKNDKSPKSNRKQQPRYRPPGMNAPLGVGKIWNGVSEAADKMGKLRMGSSKPCVLPPPMKAGGWHGRSAEVIPGSPYARKVAG